MYFKLSTKRLDLLVLTSEYAPQVLDFYKRNADIFSKYEPLIGDDFFTVEHQRRVLDFEYNNILKMNMIRYWIFEKGKHDKIIGTVSFRNIVRPIYSSCTVGYKIDRDYMNKGYCTEALSYLISYITNDLGLHRIEALILPDNAPSIHLVEKIGFQLEGVLRDKIQIDGKRLDHCMYSYIADN